MLNLNDPTSIVEWVRVFPERHALQLGAFEQIHRTSVISIREAMRQIRQDHALMELIRAAQHEPAPAAVEESSDNEYLAAAGGN